MALTEKQQASVSQYLATVTARDLTGWSAALLRIQRYTDTEVAALSPALQDAWRLLMAAVEGQRQTRDEAAQLPKRSPQTRAVWKAHDDVARKRNAAHMDVVRFYFATMAGF